MAELRVSSTIGAASVGSQLGRTTAIPADQEEEDDFLKPWLEGAATGNLVVVSPIRAALAQRLGQPVKPSVVYRLLARHGWRKVAPDTRHPKSKPEVQEAWKKNSPKCWKPC
jgi:transposase